ncbi:MAG: RluA family pseudouridine synthase [Minisyncoccia bacterium]
MKTIKIKNADAKKRIDKFLASFYLEKSRSAWKKEIKKGNVLVNNKTTKPDYILKENDELAIKKGRTKKNKKGKFPNIEIIFENNDVIVLNKPAGVLAQAAMSSSSPSITDFLKNRYPKICKVGEDELRFGIVHRLDKDTSGVMIAAKNNEAFKFLKNQFKERLTRKTYLALVYGTVDPKEGAVDLKIGRSKTNPNMQTVIDSPKKESIKSREALTIYRTLKNYNGFTLLEVQPKTGRMHQIRVHLKAIGHPVVGDKKYFFKKNALLEPKMGRQFLHARKLEICISEGKKMAFRSELPQDLSLFLDKIQQP